MRQPEIITIGSAIVATNTPVAIDMSDVNRATIEISSAGTFNNRSGVLTITASMDGTIYTAYNLLIPNATNTNAQNLTRVAASTAISTTSQSALYAIDTMMPVKYMKFLFTITDGGSPSGSFTIRLYKKYEET